MAIELMVIKTKLGTLSPAGPSDADEMTAIKIGQPLRIEATRVSMRSLQHHRLYFGGLLKLAMQYWEPEGGAVGIGDRRLIHSFVKWIERECGSAPGSLDVIGAEFLLSRARRMCELHPEAHKSVEQLHEWVKVEAGYYDVYETPAGLKKVARSISFARMNQAEFEEFYRAAFSVVWRFILSRTFENEDHAQDAVDKLLAMG